MHRTIVPRGCWIGEFTPAGKDIVAYPPPKSKDSWEWAVPFTSPAPSKYIPCRLFSEEDGVWTSTDGRPGTFNFTVTNRRDNFECESCAPPPSRFSHCLLLPPLSHLIAPHDLPSRFPLPHHLYPTSPRFACMRHACVSQVALFGGGFFEPKLLARTGPLSFDAPTLAAPMHRRVARTADPSAMRVSWTTKEGGGGDAIRWGLSPGQLDTEAGADSATYAASDLCGAPASTVGFLDPGFMHTAVIAGLPPGQLIYYAVGSDATGWSAEASFASFDAGRATTRMLLTGDMGIGYGDHALFHWPTPRAFATATHLIALNDASHEAGEGAAWDLCLHVGDIAYGTGCESTKEEKKESFFKNAPLDYRDLPTIVAHVGACNYS